MQLTPLDILHFLLITNWALRIAEHEMPDAPGLPPAYPSLVNTFHNKAPTNRSFSDLSHESGKS
jgi:hypothetical protein